jgi:SAM-dependent methyltransferase
MNETTRANYFLGHSQEELKRLMLQAAIQRPTTERLLKNAEIRPGMRVLDLGCGAGDVAMLAADLVGPSGTVVGIDRSSSVVALATERARTAGLGQVSFRDVSVDAFSDPDRFDFVIGRYVLIHQPDPVDFLRIAARLVRPGGVFALHEVDLTGGFNSQPRDARWDAIGNLILAALQEALPHYDAGDRLVEYFHAAGMPAPVLFREAVVVGGISSPVYAWVADAIRNIWPQLAAMGIATEEAISAETLANRLKSTVVESRSQLECPAQVCAWTRL